VSAQRPSGPAHDGVAITTPGLLLLATVAFVTEVALFVGVGVVAYEVLGGGERSVGAFAWWVAGTAAVVVLWGLFMAPKARRRLGVGARVATALLLCAGTAAGMVATGWTWWGWFVGVAGLAVVAAQTVLHEPGRVPQAPEGD
jgi:hypothetical protein